MSHLHFTLLSLTVSSEDAGDPIDPDRTQVLYGTSAQNAAGENQQNWKSTVSAAAKLLLHDHQAKTENKSSDVGRVGSREVWDLLPSPSRHGSTDGSRPFNID